MKVVVYPFRDLGDMKQQGNILWPTKSEMRAGKFPSSHPVGGTANLGTGQYGPGENIAEFRSRGYWASCFPEGDGITWNPTAGQSDAQCMRDIVECFGWDAMWADGVTLDGRP